MVAGFNDDLELARSQTIMQAAAAATFASGGKTR